ncbi:MAG: glutamyl-tRNA reductase [Chlamydiales bacterium]|jgi:glutamyl-tRNA reductase
MRVGVVGINHKSADLSLRENIAKACQQRFGAGSSTHGRHSFVLLNTCNRTEVYFSSENLADTHTYLLRVLRNDVLASFEHKLYSFFSYDCFSHLAHVTAGMDSAIFGETEIQGQVKQAYESVAICGELPSCIHFMFQKSLKIGKQVRFSFDLQRGMPNLETVVFQTGKSFFSSLYDKRILFVGASKINAGILKYFKTKDIGELTLCNRSREHGEALGNQEGVKVISWESLRCWQEYDMIIFGTKAPAFLLTRELVQDPPISRKMIIDLSVPRNVEPEIGKLACITLLNIDQVDGIVEKKRKGKVREMTRVKEMLSESIDKQLAIFSNKEKQRYCLLATAGA